MALPKPGEAGEPEDERVLPSASVWSSSHRRPDGLYVRTFGGDTLYAAIYLARLDVPVDYVTALGDDSYNDEMIAAWAAEGVAASLRGCPGGCPACT